MAAIIISTAVIPRLGADAPTKDGASQSDIDADTDGDGIPDVLEIDGWQTQDGTVYRTSPTSADTDGDGLNDGEEAGSLISGTESPVLYAGISDPTEVDSDGDGLDDKSEVHGWTTVRGGEYFTEPMNPDTDGDGLTDGEEAGSSVEDEASVLRYRGISDPKQIDTDDDGLDDAGEADYELDAFSQDTDGDGLDDDYEVNISGTDPQSVDTDGDGFDDRYEVEHRDDLGFDPLFEDVAVDKWDYALDFAKGAFAGELAPGDSLAWLMGNIAAGGSSFIPGIGWIVGGVADLRDTVGAMIHSDWVGAGFSATGLVPYGGDAASIPKKVAAFVAKHPELAAAVAAAVVAIKWLPDKTKVAVLERLPGWKDLNAAGATEKGLVKLNENGHLYMERIAKQIARKGHVPGAPAKFMSDGYAGEKYLTKILSEKGKVKSQVSMSTKGCVDVCNATSRRFDVVSKNVAHESKVGYTNLTESIRRQIQSDAHLMKQNCVKEKACIKSAHWHFFPSDTTNQVGASEALLDLLDELKIPYTIHLP
ncbi:hypothetical protein ACFPZL_08395 [Leucobacter soli]|uniref:hypothetical protein n=1 Tax=Leucobacter soli TaxID=2812850 RepID=UPI001C407B29|nr:hypothetical protein [Leucobacter soli]